MAIGWQKRCGSKLVSLEAAIGHIESGQTIAISPFTCSPLTLCHGLIERGWHPVIEEGCIGQAAVAGIKIFFVAARSSGCTLVPPQAERVTANRRIENQRIVQLINIETSLAPSS